MKNYYEILGVTKDASESDIKKSYRKLAMEYHPDRNPDDKSAEEKFKDVAEAYDVLGNPEKKARYDRGGNSDLDDMINQHFAGFRQQQSIRVGPSAKLTVNITVEDVFNGVHKKIKYDRAVKCDSCNGVGGEATKCSNCHGTGIETRIAQTPFGIVQQSGTCSRCHGDGEIITKPCQKCNGSGTTKLGETTEFDIPIGMESGEQLLIKGIGHHGRNTKIPGDLYISINVIPHEKFKPQGLHLLYTLKSNYVDLVLGTSALIPTIENGTIKIEIPEGTKVDKMFRIQGKGLKDKSGSSRGDMFVNIGLDIPTDLTDESKDLLKKYRELLEKSEKKS